MLHILPLMAMILSGQSKDTNHILSRPQITNISAKSFKKRFLKAIYHIYIYPPIQAICIVCWTKISRNVKSSGATEFIFSLLLNAFANAPEQSNKDGKLSFCTTSCIWRERERELKAETCLHKSEFFTLLVRGEKVTGKFGTCVKGQP